MNCYKAECNIIFCHWSGKSDNSVVAAMPKRDLSQPEVVSAQGLMKAGFSHRRVAELMGVSHTAISRANRQHQNSEISLERPRSGRSAATIPRDDRKLTSLCVRSLFYSAHQLNNEFDAATGVTILTQTIQNRFYRALSQAERPGRCVQRTSAHRGICLHSARGNVGWT